MKLSTLRPSKLPTLKANAPSLQSKENWGLGRGGRAWRKIKDQVHVRDNYTCQHCGIVTLELECDHIVNKAQGGTDDLNNLQSLCKPCHAKKTQLESQKVQGGI